MPRKALIPCSYKGCPVLIESGSGNYCEEHKKIRHSNYQKLRGDSKFTKIYSSKRWDTARKQALYRDGGFCVVCGDPAVLVDHIKELKDGGEPYLLENLQSMCFQCHTIKTQEVEKSRR